MNPKTVSYEEWRAGQMKDPEFRAAVEELDPAYEVIRMRAVRGFTQAELAERVGTTQSSIARLESGNRQPSLRFLRKVAAALKARLVVKLVPLEQELQENVVRQSSKAQCIHVDSAVSYFEEEGSPNSTDTTACTDSQASQVPDPPPTILEMPRVVGQHTLDSQSVSYS